MLTKVSSRVTLWFDVVNSQGLYQEDKDLIIRRLGNRIGKGGLLRVISQQTRSQAENRGLAIERFVELLQSALRQVPIRKKTRIGRAAKLRRLEEKRQHGILKKKRLERIPVEDYAKGDSSMRIRWIGQNRLAQCCPFVLEFGQERSDWHVIQRHKGS